METVVLLQSYRNIITSIHHIAKCRLLKQKEGRLKQVNDDNDVNNNIVGNNGRVQIFEK